MQNDLSFNFYHLIIMLVSVNFADFQPVVQRFRYPRQSGMMCQFVGDGDAEK